MLILEGSGEELLAQAEKWKGCSRLKLIEVAKPEYLSRLPEDVLWEGNVPLVPRRGRTEPITTEMVKGWLEEDN